MKQAILVTSVADQSATTKRKLTILNTYQLPGLLAFFDFSSEYIFRNYVIDHHQDKL